MLPSVKALCPDLTDDDPHVYAKCKAAVEKVISYT